VAGDTKLRSLDLFSGIGGISLALQPWCETVCYVEIDPYACGVLIKNMAEGTIDVAPVWSDVTTLGESDHHKDGNRANNVAGNIQTLCVRCHAKLHHGTLGKVG